MDKIRAVTDRAYRSGPGEGAREDRSFQTLTEFGLAELRNAQPWDKALRKTYAYTDTPFNALESEIAVRVNSEVALADAAWRSHDRDAAKTHLEAALAAAQRLNFSLADVIDRVEFKPERRQNPQDYTLLGRRETVIAGEPAVIVDYTVTVPDRRRT